MVVAVAIGGAAAGQAAATAIFGAAAAGTIAYAATAAVVAMGVSTVAFKLLGLDAPEMPANAMSTRGAKINTETSNAAIPVVYGRATVGGNIDLRDLGSGSTTYLYNVITFSEGEVEEIVDLFFDGESTSSKDIYSNSYVTFPSEFHWDGLRITIDGNAYMAWDGTQGVPVTIDDLVTEIQADPNYSTYDWKVSKSTDDTLTIAEKTLGSNPSITNPQWYTIREDVSTSWQDSEIKAGQVYTITESKRSGADGLFLIETYTGTTGQAASQELIDNIDYWTSAHQGKGIAYAMVRLKYDRDNFIGIPQITADIKGVKVKTYDGATWTTQWSDNPAWCIRDYLTNSLYGQGIDEALIDDDSFYAAAQYCDGTYDSQTYASADFTPSGIAVTKAWSGKNKFQKGSTTDDYDQYVRSDDTINIGSTGDHSAAATINIVSFDYDNLPNPNTGGSWWDYAFGLTTTVSADYNDGEFVFRVTSFDPRNDVNTVSYEIVESGTVVDTGTFTASKVWGAGRYFISPTLLIPIPITISVSSGVITYVHDGTVLYTSGATLTRDDYYSIAYMKSSSAYMKNSSVSMGAMKGIHKRFRLNGRVDTEQNPFNNVSELLSACRGMLIWSGGEYKLLIDKKETGTPAFTFDEDNIVGAWSIELGSKENTYNKAKVHFLNKSRNHDADIQIIDNQSIRDSEDNGLVLEKDIQLPFTTDPYDAQILGAMILNQSRSQIACTFTATVAALEVEIGDVVYLTHSIPGWTQKKFRVLKLDIMPNNEVGVGCIEYFDSNYDFSTTLIEESPASESVLASPFYTENPSNIQIVQNKTKTDAQITVTWDAASSGASTDHYELHLIGSGSGDNDIDQRVTTKLTAYTFPSIVIGDYTLTVEAVNNHGVHSDSIIQLFSIDPPTIPNITGLELDLGSEYGEAHGAEWSGRDCKIKWRANSVQYSYEMNDNTEADLGTIDHYVKDFQVDVKDSSGNLLRTEYVTDTWYVYTQEKSLEDAVKQGNTVPYRALQFEVWVRGYYGQKSENPAKL